MIEVEVHQQLRAFLRQQGESQWPHHLTMARLVARALRLGRSALLQVGSPAGGRGHYRLSYLMPALLWSGPVILVAPPTIQQRLLKVEIPRLRQWMTISKAIYCGDRCGLRPDRWPGDDFKGLFLVSPDLWLRDRLEGEVRLPQAIPTLLDGADDLVRWTQQHLTADICAPDWSALLLACPQQVEPIQEIQAKLTRLILQRPINPYDCYVLEAPEQELLQELHQITRNPIGTAHQSDAPPLPGAWSTFWQRFMGDHTLLWVTLNRQLGQLTLHCGPAEVATALNPIWPQQPIVLMGEALDLESEARIYRQRLGLDNGITCLKFPPDRQQDLIQLYLPDGVPLPNTPQFQSVLGQILHILLGTSAGQTKLTVLLVGDMPLKSQIGASLAAEFGSRVQVERTCLDDNGILVAGWDFWREHQTVLPAPQLLVIATLPIPSLEHPLVAGRVAHYKSLHQDWFRLYLLPEALGELQRAIAPVREEQGVVALLDSRVLHRSYGKQVLAALSPFARINYLDPGLFEAAIRIGV